MALSSFQGAAQDSANIDLLDDSAFASQIGNTSLWHPLEDRKELLYNLREQAYNASEAQKQRDYDMLMSSTQYQRAVADMKAAGLNPASLTSGSIAGASSGSGSAASSSNSHSSKKSDAAKLIAAFFTSLIKLAAS